ncbi:hypothetical protein PMIN06_002720 [Paraphaeosphaeria minitans]|uniref:Uncharacterized protein n=1 Tax=Paraphaeosphaeria minitans TaxID=565426 RepID=A0A9P6KRX8_9PLEO|nr:hypothetical protein PMIN01_04466 [Paraphaeosphaeria minitans]
MPRRSRSNAPTTQSAIDKYNAIKSHRRLGFTFDELEMLYFGEEGWGFPQPLRDTQRIWKNQRTLHGVLEVLKRYANKRPEEVRASIRNFEIQRDSERQSRQLTQATMGRTPRGLPMNQPQQGGFTSGFGDQNPFDPQPGHQLAGPTMGNVAATGPVMHGQMTQAKGAADNTLPLGVGAGLVAPFAHPAALTAQDKLNGGTPTPIELTSMKHYDGLHEESSDTRLAAPVLTPDVSSQEMSFDAFSLEQSPHSQHLPPDLLNEEQSFGDLSAPLSLEYDPFKLDTVEFSSFDDLFDTNSSSRVLDTVDFNTLDDLLNMDI